MEFTDDQVVLVVQGRRLSGAGALDLLMLVWLDGYGSGANSALLTATQGRMPRQVSDGMARRLTQGIWDNPLSREEIRNEVRERLTGRDSGTKEWVEEWKS